MNNIERELIEIFLENLDDSCFPVQIDWNNKDLYIKGFSDALEFSKLKLIESEKSEDQGI